MPVDGAQPNNYEAEAAVIGAVLLGGTATMEKAINWIKDERAFYHTDNKTIWKSIQKLFHAHETIDAVTVSNGARAFANGLTNNKEMSYYITGLFEACPSSSKVETYAKIVWERFIKREAIRSARVLGKTAEDSNRTIADVLFKHEKFAEELRRLEPTTVIDVSTIVDDTVQHINRRDNIIPFGIEFMDKAAGGMTRQELTVIGGRPGHGKTTLITNLAISLLKSS